MFVAGHLITLGIIDHEFTNDSGVCCQFYGQRYHAYLMLLGIMFWAKLSNVIFCEF